MARTVKMQWLPGTRMAPPGARAQGAVARDILGRLRARGRVSRSKFRKIRAPQCQTAVKMGGRTVLLCVKSTPSALELLTDADFPQKND